MRTICWNMDAAIGFSRERHARAWAWLEAQEPDVALLQDVVVLEDMPASFGSVVFSPKYGKRWGTAVATRAEGYRLREPANEEPFLTHLQGAVCVAESASDDAPLLVSLYSNAKEYTIEELDELPPIDDVRLCHPKEQLVWEIDLAVHELRHLLRDRRFLAGGDLNSSLLMDEVQRHDETARLFANMHDAGMVDLRPRQSAHEQQTYFKKGRRPHQLDHVFADAQTEATVLSWRVDPTPVVELELSDHAPIIVETTD
jgi:exonuclease III